MKRKVLLITPDFFKLNELIKENLSFCGYEVTEGIYYLDEPFKYKNFYQKVNNFFKKTFVDKDNKRKLGINFKNRKIEELVSTYSENHFDFALFLTVQFFDTTLINSVKKKCKRIFAYQFDSITRTPQIATNIPLFDTFYSFEKKDIGLYPVKFATNFYFDFNQKSHYPKSIDVFYIGTFVEERMASLLNIIKTIKEANLTFKIMLFANKKEDLIPYQKYGIEIAEKLLTYKEQEQMASEAKLLIDLKLSVHDGLSFRFFEAMKLNTKLITNNQSVKEYDFYSPKNILVTNEDGQMETASLLALMNSEIDSEKATIFKKYSFTNWLQNQILYER